LLVTPSCCYMLFEFYPSLGYYNIYEGYKLYQSSYDTLVEFCHFRELRRYYASDKSTKHLHCIVVYKGDMSLATNGWKHCYVVVRVEQGQICRYLKRILN
jgi:hypothetical protein